MIIRYFVTLCLLLAAATVNARDLTLDQALRLAEDHSHRLKEAKANLSAADKSVSTARAERMPTLSLDARANYVDEVAALDVEIPGLTSISREIGSNETYQADLRLSLPIYTGGRISSAVRMAESDRDYKQALEAVNRDRVYLQTRLDYFELRRALQLAAAARASQQRTEILANDINAGYAAGVADSVDLLEVRLARTKADFAVRQAEIATRSAEIKLLSGLGLSASESVTLTDALPEPVLTEIEAAEPRPDLQASRAVIGLKEAQLTNVRSDYFPTVGVYAGYSYGKPNIDMFADEFNDNIAVGAQLQWSFNLGGKTSARKQAVAFELDAANRRYDDLNESITRETDLAFEQLKLAHERYNSSRLEHQISFDNYRLAHSQHDGGALSSNRLLEIEAALTQAEANMVAARVDFYIAQSAYLYALGDERLGKGI